MNSCNTNLERSQVIKQIRIYKCCVGLISHSSSIYYNKNVFLFPGISGVGKSTIARKLSGTMTPINDDRNLLEFADNKVIVRSDFSENTCLPGKYIINNDLTGILKAVFFLIKEYEKDSFIEQLSDKGLIWRKLLTCVAPPSEGLDYLFPNYYAMIDRLMDLVPFFNFHHNLKDSPEHVAKTIRLII